MRKVSRANPPWHGIVSVTKKERARLNRWVAYHLIDAMGQSERCGGRIEDGPDKAFGRCVRCGCIDYEKYEGDRCLRFVEVKKGAR